MSFGEDGLRVAVVGATGMVGREFLHVLEQREFPIADIRLVASTRSAGTTLSWKGRPVTVQALAPGIFRDIDVALFSAGAGVSRAEAPEAVRAGALVVDNSSAWRLTDEVPLVVPEVNAQDIASHRGIIANPNCCAIPLAVALEPLRRRAGLMRVLVATYQAASGAGRALVDELDDQMRALADGRPAEARVYPRVLAGNVVPGGWRPGTDGYNEEELKIVQETRKILHLPELRIAATCVRVPVAVAHAQAVFVETERPVSPREATEVLRGSPGLVVREGDDYPTPAEVAGSDEVFVGRIRRDLSNPRGLAMWVVADNLRKGAALNAVQIAERAIGMGVLSR